VGLDVAGVQVVHPPGRLLFADQVPDETPEAVLNDLRGPGRPPEVVLIRGAVESTTEEGVKAADVVHVQVRETQVVDLLHRTER
jgi:hypothetical protein